MPDYLFFGTDEFARQTLEALSQHGWLPGLIITALDQPQGRKLLLTPPPVKLWARERNLPVFQPTNLEEPEIRARLKAAGSPLFIVAAYGKIIPPAILDLPAYGLLNIHPSLLPKYRGPSPLQTAILNGDPETGVSIMRLDEQMDHGPIIAQESYQLPPNINFPELRDELAKRGARLLMKTLPDYLAGKITPREQTHAQASYTKKFSKAEAEIQLTDPAEFNYRKILALNPNPGTWLVDNDGTRVKILSAKLETGQLKLDRVIPAGKKEMTWESYRLGKQ